MQVSRDDRHRGGPRHRRLRGGAVRARRWQLVAVVAVAVLVLGVAGALAVVVGHEGSSKPAPQPSASGSGGHSSGSGPSRSTTTSSRSGSSGSSSATTVPASTGPPYGVAETTLALVDQTRVAVVDGHVGPRQLPTMVWYPTGTGAGGQRPLVVFASGYLQCPEQYEPLLMAWAASGFVVAAPTFPLTNCDVPGGAEEGDILNQPADMSFVIGQLLAASATGTPGDGRLSGRIDPQRVAVAGQSDGGDTVAALAFDTCCMSRPVKAAMILSGAELSSFGGTYFPPGSPPMLVVQGTADTVNLPADSMTLYQDDTTGPKALVLLDGADHLGPYEGSNPTEALVAEITTDFLDQYVLGQPGAASALASVADQPGIDSLTASPGP